MVPSWSEIKSQPWFSQLSPEQQAQSLDLWSQDMQKEIGDDAEQLDLLGATTDLEKRSLFGEQVPTLDQYLPEYKARKQADQQGFFSQMGGALKTGFQDTMTGLGVTFDTLTGDNEELAQGLAAMNETQRERQANTTSKDLALEKALAENAKQFKEAKGFWPSTKELIDYAGIALTNPQAMLKTTLESAPNALVSIGATTAGGVLGAAGGPAGIAAGAVAGGSAANIPLEIPGAIYQSLMEATEGQAGSWNPTQIKDFLDANPQVKEAGLEKGAIRGAAIGVVEGLTAGLAGRVATIPERAAEKAVLRSVGKQLGKEVATPVDVADFIKAGGKEAEQQLANVAADTLGQFSKAQRVGALAGGAALETAGEGLGEFAAQKAAGEETDPTAIFQEMAAGGILSGLGVAGARIASLPGQIVNADPELRQQAQSIQNAADLVQQAATDPNASAAAAAAQAVVNQSANKLDEKAATKLVEVSNEIEEQINEQGQPTPEQKPEAETLRPEESAPVETVSTRAESVVPPEPTVPVVPEQPPAPAQEAAPEPGTAGLTPSPTIEGFAFVPDNLPPAETAPQTPTPENTPDARIQNEVQETGGTPPVESQPVEPLPEVQAQEGAAQREGQGEEIVRRDPTKLEQMTLEEAMRVLEERIGPNDPKHPDYSRPDWREIEGRVDAGEDIKEVLVDAAEGYLQVERDRDAREAAEIEATRTSQEKEYVRAQAKMTPDQFDREVTLPELKRRNAGKKIAKDAEILKRLKAFRGDGDYLHRKSIEEAVAAGLPVSAKAVDTYGLTLPEGYVREGDLYVYRPNSPQGVVPTAPLPEGQPMPGGSGTPSMQEADLAPMPGVLPGGDKPVPMAPRKAYETGIQHLEKILPNAPLRWAQEVHSQVSEGADPIQAAETAAKMARASKNASDAVLKAVRSGEVPSGVPAQEMFARLYDEEMASSPSVVSQTPPVDETQAPQTAARQALEEEVSMLSESGKAKWTPEVLDAAEDYVQTGNPEAYAKLNKTQKSLTNRVREQLGIQDSVDEMESGRQKRIAASKAQTPSTYSPRQIEQSTDIPTAQVVGRVSEADFQKGLDIVGNLIRNARATVISDSLANLLSRSDITEAEKDAFRKGAQGIYSNGRAIIARDSIRQTVLHTTPAQAAAAVIFHELMHKGSDILRSDPKLAETYQAWRSMLDENVTDEMLDSLVRRKGYSSWSDWKTNPASKLRAQEEVFVRQMEDFFNRKGDLLPKEKNLLTKFLDWVKGMLESVFGVPVEGRFKDAILEDWGRKFIKAIQTSNEVSVGEIQRSLSETDAEYMAAVEAGDMEKAQRMVDEAAKAAGFDKKLFHGTTATEDVLEQGRGPSGGYEDAKAGLQKLAQKFGLSEWSYVDAYPRMLAANYGGVTQQDVDTALRLKKQLLASQKSSTPDKISQRLAFNVFNFPAGELELGVHLGNKSAANMFGEVFPFWVRLGKSVRLPDLGTWNYQGVIREMRKKGINVSKDEYERIFNSQNPNQELRQVLFQKGVDSVVYKNEAEGRGDSFIVFDPSQIKSADPVTYDENGNVILLSQRFNPESPDIRYSIEAPVTDTRTGTDRLATFEQAEKDAIKDYMKGNPQFDKLKQFLGLEEAAELGQVESILPLKMAAMDTIGFNEDKGENPIVSKQATANAYEIAEKLTTNSGFGVEYQQAIGPESAATAVLQMELLRYALALSRKGDNRLLSMLRKNWNSIVLGKYITATTSGRILGVRSNYVSEVLRTIDRMDAEMKKTAVEKVRQDGIPQEQAEGIVRDLDALIKQAQIDYDELTKSFADVESEAPSVDPYAWIERALGKIDAADQALVGKLFRDLARLDKMEAKREEFKKAANAPEASFLDDIYNEEIDIPNSPEELDQEIQKTKARISETLKQLNQKSEVLKKVKEKLPKKDKSTAVTDVEKVIAEQEKRLKTTPGPKAPPKESLRQLIRANMKQDMGRAIFVTEAAKFGATEAQANTLYDRSVVEADLLNAEKGKPITKFSKLLAYIKSNPSLISDPASRSAAIQGFLIDNGYAEEQAKRMQSLVEPLIQKASVKAKQQALDRAVAVAKKKEEAKATPAEKNLGNKIGALSENSFKLLESDLKKIRMGLGDLEADPSQSLASALGFNGFRPTDYQALSELDAKITQAAKDGRPHDMAEGLRELYELLGRRRAPKTLLEVLAVAYNNSALSSVGTLAINVVAPSGSLVSRVILDLGRAVALRKWSEVSDIANILADSFKKIVKEAEYGLLGGASTVAMNQQVQRVTSLQRDFNEALSVLRGTGRNTSERRKQAGLSAKPSAMEKTKAAYTVMLATTDIVRRVLATTDHTWSAVLQNYFLKTQAIKVLDGRVPREAYIPALFNIGTNVSQILTFENGTINGFAQQMGELKKAGNFTKEALLELTRTPAAEELSSDAVTFDRDFKGAMRRVITAYDTPEAIERHLLNALRRQRNEAALRANDRMKLDVLNFLNETVPGSAEAVQKFIENETEYEMGTHQGEEAPTPDFMNGFTNLVRAAGQSITAKNPILGRMVVGYFGVPANLLNRAMWYTPYGIYRYFLGSAAAKNLATKGKFYQQSMETQAQINQRLVEALAGTAGVMALLALKSMDEDDDEGFNITLSGPTNKTEKDAWKKMGHRQGSIEYVTKDGTVTSLNWARGPFEPLKVALMMVGAMDDMRLNRKLGDGVLGSSISDYLSAMFYGWSKQAAFFGAKNTIGAVLSPAPDASMASSLLYSVGPVVPYSGAISSVERFLVGPERFYGREGAIYLNLPIARSLLTERAVNALGDPQGLVPSSAWSSLNDRAWYAGLPIMVSGQPTGNDKLVYDFILRRGTGPGLPQRAQLENENGLLWDSQWLDYVAARGRIVKSEMIRQLPRLERMDDEDLSKAFGEISSKATREAKRQFGYK